MTDTYTSEQFLELESQVWSALARGDKQADSRLLADEFLGVYPSGFASKEDHIGQFASGPSVADYDLSVARIKALSSEVVLLSYCVRFTRYAPGSQPEMMYVTSIWQHCGGKWKNIFSQDTPAETDQTR